MDCSMKRTTSQVFAVWIEQDDLHHRILSPHKTPDPFCPSDSIYRVLQLTSKLRLSDPEFDVSGPTPYLESRLWPYAPPCCIGASYSSSNVQRFQNACHKYSLLRVSVIAKMNKFHNIDVLTSYLIFYCILRTWTNIVNSSKIGRRLFLDTMGKRRILVSLGTSRKCQFHPRVITFLHARSNRSRFTAR